MPGCPVPGAKVLRFGGWRQALLKASTAGQIRGMRAVGVVMVRSRKNSERLSGVGRTFEDLLPGRERDKGVGIAVDDQQRTRVLEQMVGRRESVA